MSLTARMSYKGEPALRCPPECVVLADRSGVPSSMLIVALSGTSEGEVSKGIHLKGPAKEAPKRRLCANVAR